MLYKTHKAGGCLFALIGYEFMLERGLLPTSVNPLVELALLYPAASFGSTVSDLDHHLGSVKEQTPANILINKILHLGKCTHRSWQTHSLYFTGVIVGLMWVMLWWITTKGVGFLNDFDILILQSLLTGFSLGLASHLVLDSLTTAGIWLLPKIKFRLVPNSTTFKTGGTWENIVRWVLYMAVIIAFVRLIFTMCGLELVVYGVRIL